MSNFFRGQQPPQQPYSRIQDSSYQSGGLPGGPRAAPRSQYAPRGGYDAGPPAPSKSAYTDSSRGHASSLYQVVACPRADLVMRNRLIVNPRDFDDGQHFRIKGDYAATTLHDPTGTIQPGTIGFSGLQREWMELSSTGDEVTIEPIPNNVIHDLYLGSLDLELSFVKLSQRNDENPFKADEMSHIFKKAFDGQMFGMGQIAGFDFHGISIKAVVLGMQNLELSATQKKGGANISKYGVAMGIVMDQTDITFIKAGNSPIKIKASANKPPPNAILAPNFKFEDMGIGGLDDEFSNIFRRAFASRVFPAGIVEKLGIQHVKGILLHGPPGTGKTLMARQIGKMLNAREPKVVNGPEILNKYVGASEENIRKLFADAEKEYKDKGDESGLHIIIFDELDAICKQRGSTNSGTGVGDSVVNQLLSKMDGVDQLNNILIIGMTNRLDMIDEALLRPGRLEVHMEISLPDERGRVQILNIHLSKMKQSGIMDKDVDIAELAAKTKNFSGAEIGGLVKSATSFAFNRHVKVGSVAAISEDVNKLKVNRGDFMLALDEVHPAFGVAEEELQRVIQNGLIHYDGVERLLKEGEMFVKQVQESMRTPLVTVLLHGPAGSGKTAMAATIAQASNFPFIKLVSPENMVGMNDAAKVGIITKAFVDSYKSPLSVIVVDNIERLLEWVPLGPRFSQGVLQALLVLMGRRPPKGHRLLVLATTSLHYDLRETQLTDVFDAKLEIPPISTIPALKYALENMELFDDPSQLQRALRKLADAGFGEPKYLREVGIKKLVSLVEMARQDEEDVAERLYRSIINLQSITSPNSQQ